MTLYDVDRRLVRGRTQVGVDTVTVDATTPDHASELALEVDHGLGPHILISCRNIRVAPTPQAIIDEYCPTGPSAALEGFVVSEQPDGSIVAQTLKRRPGRPRKAA